MTDLCVTIETHMIIIDRSGNASVLMSIDGAEPYWVEIPVPDAAAVNR